MGPKNAQFLAKFSGPIKPSLWWRYRDHEFDLWQQGLPALHQFTDYINSLYPTIKFELVFSEHELNIFDLTLHLNNGFIRTDVYSKPTDSHLHPPPSSYHPKYYQGKIMCLVLTNFQYFMATHFKFIFPGFNLVLVFCLFLHSTG